MMNLQWIEFTPVIKSFRHIEEPWITHVIKTGFNNVYFIVHEDAYEHQNGTVEFCSKEQVEKRYDIIL